MQISKEQIEEFKKIYWAKFKEELSDERAHELGLRLLQLFKVIYRPLPKNHRCPACNPVVKASDFDKGGSSI